MSAKRLTNNNELNREVNIHPNLISEGENVLISDWPHSDTNNN